MTADNIHNFRRGPRGHFCGCCEKAETEHDGCITDGTYVISPQDPSCILARAMRDNREWEKARQKLAASNQSEETIG